MARERRRYVVEAEVTISVYTEVEAVSAAEARRIASGRGMVSLCHQCARGEPAEKWCTLGELDGEPSGLRVVGDG